MRRAQLTRARYVSSWRPRPTTTSRRRALRRRRRGREGAGWSFAPDFTSGECTNWDDIRQDVGLPPPSQPFGNGAPATPLFYRLGAAQKELASFGIGSEG